jgi:hypothetical protein
MNLKKERKIYFHQIVDVSKGSCCISFLSPELEGHLLTAVVEQ